MCNSPNVTDEKYYEFKLNFQDRYQYSWSFYRDIPALNEIENWYKEQNLKHTKCHRSDDYAHIMLGTNNSHDALIIKMSWIVSVKLGVRDKI